MKGSFPVNRANMKGNSMDDKQIIDLFFDRNEQALEYTAEKYDSYCYAVARQILGSDEDAKECVNDALLAAWDSIPPNRPEKLSVYLGKITKNLSVNKLRAINAKKRGADFVKICIDELCEAIPAADDPAGMLESEELTRAIERGLKSVGTTNRRIFISRYYYLESIGEIAARFCMNENQIKQRLKRTREKLRKTLRKEGLTDE